jgi:hypothetical protein
MLSSAYQLRRKVYPKFWNPIVLLMLTTSDLVFPYCYVQRYRMGSHENHKTAKNDTMYHLTEDL